MYKLGFFCIFFASSLSIDAQNTALADSIVKYQMPSGGWVKNQDWQKGADLAYMSKCMKTGIGSTIDNGATTSEMKVLAKVYVETHDKRYRDAVCQWRMASVLSCKEGCEVCVKDYV